MTREQAIEYIKEHYSDTDTEDICKVTGLKHYQVYNIAYYHDIKKSREFRRKKFAPILEKYGKEYHFKKGLTPHNKGKKMPAEVYEKVKHTMFKKGNVPPTAKYDGCIVWRKYDGKKYAFIRVAKAKWITYHTYLWMQEHGDLPEDHVVIFKDGNHLNFDIDNLECVSRRELLERNSLWNKYPKDLARAIHLLGVTNRRIRKQEK